MTGKAPSEGTKVFPGQNAPTKNEPAGPTSGSLAEQSYREGGEFASNTGVRTENLGSSGTTQSSNAGTAPSYVADQYIKDQSGPHGRNIQEGFDASGTKDGLQAAMNAEPGSINDPSRVAEQQFEQNQNAKTRAAGPKQGDLTNETKYDALGSEVSS